MTTDQAAATLAACSRCAAYVAEIEVHRRWHLEIEGTDQPTSADGPARYWILDEHPTGSTGSTGGD